MNNNKNILITGTTSGIGLEIFNLLSKDNNVFGCSRRKSELKNYCSCDLTDFNSIDEMFNKACEFFQSKIDVLINCAGQYIYSPIEKTKKEEIIYLTDLNFKSVYYLSLLTIPLMKKNGFGRIINIGSISGVVGEGNATLYSATKSALSGLTKALALEVAQDNITVNQINPGWVQTPLVDNCLTSEEKQEVIDVTPQRRFIEPAEVANMCKYIISDEAKGLTGQNINLCAGLSIGC